MFAVRRNTANPRTRFLAGATGLALWGVAGAVVLIIVVSSPVLIAWVSNFRSDWNVLSDVGQAYGLPAALLSGAALLFIGLSLIHQASQTRIARKQTARSMQVELFRLAYDHPDLQAAWTTSADPPDGEWRKRTYSNLIFMYLRMTYLTHEISDATIRRNMANRFRTQRGRDFWESARDAYSVDLLGWRDRRFFALTEQEYRRSLDTPALDESALVETPSLHKSKSEGFPGAKNGGARSVVWLSAGAVGGATIAALLVRRRVCRSTRRR